MDRRIYILVLICLVVQFACSLSGESESVKVASDSTIIKENLTNLADTIEIWDDFASEPFLFKGWEVRLDSLLLFLPTDVTIDKEVKPSQYHADANDSIARIKYGQSIIEFIKTPSVGYIEYAIITDREIQFQKNIRIGDTYEEVCKKFPETNKGKNPFRKIYINSGEATSTLIMEFKDGKLFKVVYWPYTG